MSLTNGDRLDLVSDNPLNTQFFLGVLQDLSPGEDFSDWSAEAVKAEAHRAIAVMLNSFRGTLLADQLGKGTAIVPHFEVNYTPFSKPDEPADHICRLCGSFKGGRCDVVLEAYTGMGHCRLWRSRVRVDADDDFEENDHQRDSRGRFARQGSRVERPVGTPAQRSAGNDAPPGMFSSSCAKGCGYSGSDQAAIETFIDTAFFVANNAVNFIEIYQTDLEEQSVEEENAVYQNLRRMEMSALIGKDGGSYELFHLNEVDQDAIDRYDELQGLDEEAYEDRLRSIAGKMPVVRQYIESFLEIGPIDDSLASKTIRDARANDDDFAKSLNLLLEREVDNLDIKHQALEEADEMMESGESQHSSFLQILEKKSELLEPVFESEEYKREVDKLKDIKPEEVDPVIAEAKSFYRDSLRLFEYLADEPLESLRTSEDPDGNILQLAALDFENGVCHCDYLASSPTSAPRKYRQVLDDAIAYLEDNGLVDESDDNKKMLAEFKQRLADSKGFSGLTSGVILEGAINEAYLRGASGEITCDPLDRNVRLFGRLGFKQDKNLDYRMRLSADDAWKFWEGRQHLKERKDAMRIITRSEAEQWEAELIAIEQEDGPIMCGPNPSDHTSKRTDDDRPVQKIIDWQGLKLGLQYLPGDKRHGRTLTAAYGHVRGTYGQADDGMAIDVWVNLDGTSKKIWKLQQLTKDGKHDEYKYILGCSTYLKARKLYSDNMPSELMGRIEQVGIGELEPHRRDADEKFKEENIFRDERGRFAKKSKRAAPTPKSAKPRTADIAKIETKLADTIGQAKLDAANRNLKAVTDNSTIITRTTPKGLKGILEDERMKTQFETSSSRGRYAPALRLDGERADAESRMFEERGNLEDVERAPVYGYLANKDSVIDNSATGWVSSYGNVMIELNEQKRSQTTFTGGDSLGLSHIPSPLDNPSAASIVRFGLPSSTEFENRKIMGGSSLSRFAEDKNPNLASVRECSAGSYVEAQIHGGVNLKDVAAFHYHAEAGTLFSTIDAEYDDYEHLTSTEKNRVERDTSRRREMIEDFVGPIRQKLPDTPIFIQDESYEEDSPDSIDGMSRQSRETAEKLFENNVTIVEPDGTTISSMEELDLYLKGEDPMLKQFEEKGGFLDDDED